MRLGQAGVSDFTHLQRMAGFGCGQGTPPASRSQGVTEPLTCHRMQEFLWSIFLSFETITSTNPRNQRRNHSCLIIQHLNKIDNGDISRYYVCTGKMLSRKTYPKTSLAQVTFKGRRLANIQQPRLQWHHDGINKYARTDISDKCHATAQTFL